MGYTHYFERFELTHNQKTWTKFSKDVKQLSKKLDFQITGSDGDIETEPVFNKDEISFNGVGEESHETFIIVRDMSIILTAEGRHSEYKKKQWEKDEKIFSFCKTARKPYDLFVTAVLILYKYYFKEKVHISGDGGDKGFEAGERFIRENYLLKAFPSLNRTKNIPD